MPSTFIDLTNQLLRKFNENTITEGSFVGARGVQGRAQDIIRNTVNRINQQAWNWPFNAVQKEVTLVPGQEQYSWPSDMMRPEWESFQIQADTVNNIGYRSLRFIDRQNYYETSRNDDDTAGTLGRNTPDFVYPSHGSGFGVSPSPNAAYKLKYNYWATPLPLVQPTDTVSIPSQFDYVIISGAAIDMHDFYDNAEAASLMRQSHAQDMSVMRSLLLNNYKALRDTRVNHGGGQYRSTFFF